MGSLFAGTEHQPFTFMPIYFDAQNQQVQVDFAGGDIIAGPCGDDENTPDAIGIIEASVSGASGDLADDIEVEAPTVVLNFHTKESLDSFISVLEEYRALKFQY